MASIITATTTSGLTQSADNSGVLQLASGVGNLVTVPAVTGTAMVSGNMPAFSAYQSSAQSVTNNTFTKVQFQTEDFDTNNNFDNTTNYRFTPTVAGYYQINASVYPLTSTSNTIAVIYRNGSAFKYVQIATNNSSSTVSSIIYFNGSTDYVEIYAYFTGVTPSVQNGAQYTYFNGCLVRAA